MVVLSKVLKLDNFDSQNSLKLSLTNIPGLCSYFVWCESFLESSSPGNIVLSETKLENGSGSSNFMTRVYLPLIQKDSVTHIYGLAVYVKEGLPFAQHLL